MPKLVVVMTPVVLPVVTVVVTTLVAVVVAVQAVHAVQLGAADQVPVVQPVEISVSARSGYERHVTFHSPDQVLGGHPAVPHQLVHGPAVQAPVVSLPKGPHPLPDPPCPNGPCPTAPLQPAPLLPHDPEVAVVWVFQELNADAHAEFVGQAEPPVR